eukprot:Seg972.5 transcript_id=Seg972.5/GoldUCD/mRNA.D3Y31 product="40S ribosomal protein S30" pseudo=true protein_id=Seg972.5/GoldUCD/D3Y31
MQIFVAARETSTLDISPATSVADLKEILAYQTGVNAAQQVLTLGGHPLIDEQSLSENGVQALSTISFNVGLLGGKVHGSLARAGKVKGQTPKVDAQEKKKAKTGRAKRRQQYNQRFVNYVQSFGRRRGPNSNAQ